MNGHVNLELHRGVVGGIVWREDHVLLGCPHTGFDTAVLPGKRTRYTCRATTAEPNVTQRLSLSTCTRYGSCIDGRHRLLNLHLNRGGGDAGVVHAFRYSVPDGVLAGVLARGNRGRVLAVLAQAVLNRADVLLCTAAGDKLQLFSGVGQSLARRCIFQLRVYFGDGRRGAGRPGDGVIICRSCFSMRNNLHLLACANIGCHKFACYREVDFVTSHQVAGFPGGG